MRYPFLVAVVLVVIVAAGLVAWFVLRSAGRRAGRKGWVANTGYVRDLPQYRALVARARTLFALAVLSVVGLALALAVTAGQPVDRRVEHERLASRDIVLCLDSSGSMIPYDAQIGDGFRQIVQRFSGERLSLHLWSAQTMVLFPLTNDYEMADSVLEHMSTLMREGYMGTSGDSVYVTSRLLEFLSGTDDPNGEMSSLAGDGLASCVLGFDHADQERSRMIILATDNEIMGPQIYTLAQAMEFARQHSIVVTALYPRDIQTLSTEGAELRDLVRTTGGEFYDAASPGSIEGIIADIEAQQRVDLEGAPTVVETDRPGQAMWWVAVGLLALLGFAGWARV